MRRPEVRGPGYFQGFFHASQTMTAEAVPGVPGKKRKDFGLCDSYFLIFRESLHIHLAHPAQLKLSSVKTTTYSMCRVRFSPGTAKAATRLLDLTRLRSRQGDPHEPSVAGVEYTQDKGNRLCVPPPQWASRVGQCMRQDNLPRKAMAQGRRGSPRMRSSAVGLGKPTWSPHARPQRPTGGGRLRHDCDFCR